MQRSENIDSLAKALASFQREMPRIDLDSTVTVKTKMGGTYKFKYATLANIMKKSLPILTKHDLAVTQGFAEGGLITTLMHASGQFWSSSIPIDITSGTMQEIGSRISYIKRYGISAMLGVVAEEDEDGNIASGHEFTKEDKNIVREPMTYSSLNKEIVPPGASSQAAEGTQAIPVVEQSKHRKALEIKLKDSGWDRELFKEWLFTLGRLEKKDGKLSMNNLPDKTIKDLLGGYSWDWVIKHFNLWVDEKNKTTNDIQESLLEK